MRIRKSLYLSVALLAIGLSATSPPARTQLSTGHAATDNVIGVSSARFTVSKNPPDKKPGDTPAGSPLATDNLTPNAASGVPSRSAQEITNTLVDPQHPEEIAKRGAAAATKGREEGMSDARRFANGLRTLSSSGAEVGSVLLLISLLVGYIMFHRLYGSLILKK